MIRRLSDFAGLLALAAVLAVAWALTHEWRPAPTSAGLRAGLDTGFRAIPLLAAVDDAGVAPMQGWMRIRGVPERRSTVAERTQTRAALRDLRERGVRRMVFFMAAGYPWASGVRQLTGSKGTVPLDLRDAYERGRWLGRRYGAFVDAWEVDNEPDMVYVRDNPENYAAYLKAMYWGLKRGAAQAGARASGRDQGSRIKASEGGEEAVSDKLKAESGVGAVALNGPPNETRAVEGNRPYRMAHEGGGPSGPALPQSDRSPSTASSSWNSELGTSNFPRAPRDEPSLENTAGSTVSGFRSFRNRTSASDPWNLALGTWNLPRAPRVVMAPMALPPGPYFDALLDNDLLSYTEGFNFHYYGFEEDFPGVYAQHRAAVEERSDEAESGVGAVALNGPSNETRAVEGNRPYRKAHGSQVGAVALNGPQNDAIKRGEEALSDKRKAESSSNGAAAPSLRREGMLKPQLSTSTERSTHSVRRALPIFISEYGNGLLSGRAAATVEGRVRQWRDHRALAGHMRALRIEAPMAFYLRPYLEDEAREYGLTMRARADARASDKEQGSSNREDGGRRTTEGRKLESGNLKPEGTRADLSPVGAVALNGPSNETRAVEGNRPYRMASEGGGPSGPALPQTDVAGVQRSGLSPQVSAPSSQLSGFSSQRSALRPPQFTAGGLTFTPADFGLTEPEPWMADIGRPIGGAEASPALAWMLNQPPLPEPEAWEVVVPEPSPVVLDFVAGEGLRQSKTMRGHQLTTRMGERLTGRGTVWVYNFAARPVTGVVRLEGHGGAAVEQRLTLKPGERRAVPVEFAVSTERFHGVQWRAQFEAEDDRVPPARLASWVYPHVGQFVQKVLTDLQHAAPAAAQNAARIDGRPLARGEAPLFPQGRWRVTKGVTVEERGDTWRFTVTEFPDEVMRPAMAELPLPDGFRFPRYSMILAQVRLAPRRAEEVRAHPEPRGEPENSALDREVFGVYFRTAQGGLYVTTMNFAATTEGLNFGQVADNFTPFVYGRNHLPWRFLENEPAALALVFRPRLLPATYEVRGARIVELIEAKREEAGSGKR